MEASALPTLSCIGVITEVGKVAPAKSEVYLTTPIKIAAKGTGRGKDIYFTFDAAWFTPEFHAAVREAGSIKEYFDETYGDQTYKNSKGETKNAATAFAFVYGNNFSSDDGNALLQSIFGTKEAFEEFAQAAIALNVDAENPDLNALTKFLNEQLVGKLVGYTLRQRSIKTDRVKEDGKAVFIRDNNYDVKETWAATDKNVKSKIKSAEKSKNGRFKVTFTADVLE